MLPYWGICFYFIIMLFVDLYSANKNTSGNQYNKVIVSYLFFCSCAVLVIFGGIRINGTGVDDWMYRESFNEISNKTITLSITSIIEQYKYEPVTTFFMDVVAQFTKNADIFMFVYLMISVSINSYAYKKYTPLILVSLAIYSSHLYLNKDLNQIRFGLSSALFVLSLCFYSESKYYKVVIFMVLACLTHQTALAGIIVLFLNPLLKWRFLPIILVLCSIPLGVIGGKVLFGGFFGYLPQVVSSYQGTDFDTDIPIFSIANFKNIIFIFIFCYYLSDEKYCSSGQAQKFSRLMIIIYAIGASVRIVFHDFSIIGGRVGNLFLHVEPLLISLLASKFLKHRFIVLSALIAILIYYYYYNTYLNPQSLLGYGVSNTFKIW
ncbi:TPA: EpsG family protein [Pluralibacter gergoviae]|uniref:EpsG family protein n=1 Tax=Pluralibacter gergoviae TaxID=61647 RepID=UPI000A57F15E|nr:EpsG family protein [Pluralibacter gergoviae]MCK1066688.1 EpsG family protein [Pluralibacter gergoviae]MCV7759088.1 EpsG family protein [Pluralibacter gergoviae]HDS1151430.1 EpsG family protein [Pluralibacter gergoviae]